MKLTWGGCKFLSRGPTSATTTSSVTKVEGVLGNSFQTNSPKNVSSRRYVSPSGCNWTLTSQLLDTYISVGLDRVFHVICQRGILSPNQQSIFGIIPFNRLRDKGYAKSRAWIIGFYVFIFQTFQSRIDTYRTCFWICSWQVLFEVHRLVFSYQKLFFYFPLSLPNEELACIFFWNSGNFGSRKWTYRPSSIIFWSLVWWRDITFARRLICVLAVFVNHK